MLRAASSVLHSSHKERCVYNGGVVLSHVSIDELAVRDVPLCVILFSVRLAPINDAYDYKGVNYAL